MNRTIRLGFIGLAFAAGVAETSLGWAVAIVGKARVTTAASDSAIFEKTRIYYSLGLTCWIRGRSANPPKFRGECYSVA